MVELIPKGLKYETIAHMNDAKLIYTTISTNGHQKGLEYQHFLFRSIWHMNGIVYAVFVKSLPLTQFNLNDYEELEDGSL